MAQYRRTIVRRMGPTRIVVLGLAITSGLFAFRMAGDAAPPAPEPERIVVEADVEDVLVATAEIRRGAHLDQTNLKWQSWPRVAITPALIRKSEAPRFIEENKGAQARVVFSPLEPIRRDRLTRDERTGALAEIIPVGSRAVAISIDANGTNTAGGFVLPQDRVDVVRTFLSEGDGARHSAETLLKNVRVLAIGRNVEQKQGEPGVLGMTATLEVDVNQAEKLILAQRTGQLSLTLRGFSEPAEEAPKTAKAEAVAVVTVVRNGARQEYTVRGAAAPTPPQTAQSQQATPQAPRESVKIASRASF